MLKKVKYLPASEIKDKFISIQNNDEINTDKFLKEDSIVDNSRYYDLTYSHRQFLVFRRKYTSEMLPGVGKQIFNFLEIASTIDDNAPVLPTFLFQN